MMELGARTALDLVDYKANTQAGCEDVRRLLRECEERYGEVVDAIATRPMGSPARSLSRSSLQSMSMSRMTSSASLGVEAGRTLGTTPAPMIGVGAAFFHVFDEVNQ